jgi:tRNA-Thr(GGU) m(6)t(6)A37 methyltransferase TsaA
MQAVYNVTPIGIVHNKDDDVRIEVYPQYEQALLGIEQFSHILVLYWFDENDTPEGRSILQVHPCSNPKNPLTGVFATHSPRRPNLIALTKCRIVAIEGTSITVDRIDAYDGSPVMDIKSYFPDEEVASDYRFPEWERDKTE